jgi:hypothetical protein
MIVFDLSCDGGHRFEGWFGSSADFEEQSDRGLLNCPRCGSAAVSKAPMAPAVPRKGNQRALAVAEPLKADRLASDGNQAMARGTLPPEVAEAMRQLAQAQAKALESSRWVGDRFAQQSRAMHYGETDVATIHGRATVEEARELLEEGIAVTPLPFPVAPPEELN